MGQQDETSPADPFRSQRFMVRGTFFLAYGHLPGWSARFSTCFIGRVGMMQRQGHALSLQTTRQIIIPGVPPYEIRPTGHWCQPVGGSIVSHTASRTAI